MPEPENLDVTVLLAGPLAQRGPLMASLERAGARLEPDQGLHDDDPTQGWVAVRHADVDHVVGVASRAGWALRMHWNTPDCRVCGGTRQTNTPDGLGPCPHCEGTGKTNQRPPSPEEQLQATIDGLHRRLAALEGKG